MNIAPFLRAFCQGLAGFRDGWKIGDGSTTMAPPKKTRPFVNAMQITRVFFTPLLLASLTSIPATAAELIVDDGETRTITAGESRLELDDLRIGNGAVIRFAPGVTRWEVYADRAWIGRGVVLEGNGRDGGEGASGPQQVTRAEPCARGVTGPTGSDGGAGGDGVSVYMQLGLMHFDSLSVFANGGKGGRGGQGGTGGEGGTADGCHAGAGGDGGDGGTGGDGGSGGEIRIVYWSADRKTYIPVSNYGPGVHVENYGGEAGDEGLGGKGGRGGKGGWSKRGSGKQVSRNYGEAGRDGVRGQRGKPGKTGRMLVQPVSGPPQ